MRPITPKLEFFIFHTMPAFMAKMHKLKTYKTVNLYPLF